MTQTERLRGYKDAAGTPSAGLLGAINHTDQSLGQVVGDLKSQGLLGSTLIIITAKHGNSPIDHSKRNNDRKPRLIDNMRKGLLALAYQDGDLASIWLTDESQTARVAAMLSQPAIQAEIGAERILLGQSLRLYYNDPVKDKRTPVSSLFRNVPFLTSLEVPPFLLVFVLVFACSLSLALPGAKPCEPEGRRASACDRKPESSRALVPPKLSRRDEETRTGPAER